MAIHLRPAEDRDLPDLHRMMADLQDVERAIHPVSRPPGAGMAVEHVAHLRKTAADNQGLYLVAEDGDSVVGFLVCYVDVEEEAYLSPARQRAGRIADLWVDASCRGGDLVDRFFTAAEDHFRALGLSVMIVSHLVGNDRAGRAYQKRGFVPLETLLERPIR